MSESWCVPFWFSACIGLQQCTCSHHGSNRDVLKLKHSPPRLFLTLHLKNGDPGLSYYNRCFVQSIVEELWRTMRNMFLMNVEPLKQPSAKAIWSICVLSCLQYSFRCMCDARLSLRLIWQLCLCQLGECNAAITLHHRQRMTTSSSFSRSFNWFQCVPYCSMPTIARHLKDSETLWTLKSEAIIWHTLTHRQIWHKKHLGRRIDSKTFKT